MALDLILRGFSAGGYLNFQLSPKLNQQDKLTENTVSKRQLKQAESKLTQEQSNLNRFCLKNLRVNGIFQSFNNHGQSGITLALQ